jgi:hypothetical protein
MNPINSYYSAVTTPSILKMSQTIDTVFEKIVPLVGKEFHLPVTRNKGFPGIFLEQCTDIPQTSNCLDCVDGELKNVQIKQNRRGDFVPKESIAITMVRVADLVEHDFVSSRCYAKLSRMLVVPYFRTGETIRYMAPTMIDKNKEEYADLFHILETDYNEIRKTYLETGVLSSSTGTLLQTRTKGKGHGSVSRAFYLRAEFIKRFVPLLLR